MTDDDNTPPTYENGGEHQHSGPYRGLDPMQAELLRRLDRLGGIEHDVDRIDRAVVALTASRRFWGWAAGIGVPALIAGAFTLLLWSHDQVSTSAERVGRTEARIEGQAKLIDLLQQEIVELRRRAGLDGHPNSDMWTLPDQLSTLGYSGRVLLQLPKLQNGQGLSTPNEHSMELLQSARQDENGMISRIAHVPSRRWIQIRPGPRFVPSKSSSSMICPLGDGASMDGDGDGDVHDNAKTTTTSKAFRIP